MNYDYVLAVSIFEHYRGFEVAMAVTSYNKIHIMEFRGYLKVSYVMFKAYFLVSVKTQMRKHYHHVTALALLEEGSIAVDMLHRVQVAQASQLVNVHQ